MESEVRVKHILDITKTHLTDVLLEESVNTHIRGLKHIQDFLETEKCLLLCAYLEKGEINTQLTFTKEVPAEFSQKTLIVFKDKPSIITNDNLKSLQILSMNNSPLTSLYSTLNNVFVPLIQNKRNFNYTTIKKKINNLNEDLRYAIVTTNSDGNVLVNKNEQYSTVITSLEHEVEYWNNHTQFATDETIKKSSEAFRNLLKPLSNKFVILDSLSFPDVEDVLETAHNVLDDLWRNEPPFPKSRITHLIDLIASSIVTYIEKHLQNLNVWFVDYSAFLELISQCKSLAEFWITTCEQLTKIFWPNFSLNPWNGGPYLPQNLIGLNQRLQEILNIRAVHRQLTRLLNSNEQKDLKTDQMFAPFNELNILQCEAQDESTWLKANKQFEYLLKPAEERVALKLKQQLSQIKNNTRQLLHEFTRYSELIERPAVGQILENERRNLLNELQNYVDELNNSIGETTVSTIKYETSQAVKEILSSRLLEEKVNEVQKTQKLLGDLPGHEQLNKKVVALMNDAKQQTTEYFNTWTSEIILQINNKTLSLQENDPVVHFSANKMMYVNYSPRLVTLITEVRQLSALNYKIPHKIEQLSDHAKQFIKYAKILEQIANFHNTIGDRMINSQKPIMLASALELSKLVQDQKVVAWSDTQSVHVYVDKLKCAVEKLSKENNMLASYHYKILDKIKELENVDLIKYYDKWKTVAKQIREIMSEVEQKGFTNLNVWKNEVDKNLSSNLEKQYLKCLDTVHLYLPEIYTDLVYQRSQLQFSPDEDVLRNKYQQQLKVFIEIPHNFRGVSTNTDVFAEITERNKDKLDGLNKKTDELFDQLREVVKHWQSWLSLGNLDKSQLTSWEHWDLHFRASKNFGQEIAKLPSTEEKVGCFIIGLSRLRTDLEFHNRSYWDQLVSTLKDSIAVDVVKLQDYVNSSTSTLTKQPVTIEQIDEVDTFYDNVLKQLPEMETCYKEMILKSNTLSSWTREKVDSVNRLQGAWERLQHLLDNHQHTIEKQRETIKTTLNITNENLVKELERFVAKWEQVNSRPGSGQISTDSFEQLKVHSEVIKQKHEQWNELMERKNKLISDYNKFGIEHTEFPPLHQIEDDLEKQVELWSTFDDFSSGLEKLSEEDWIVFRKKHYRLGEFMTEWENKLEKMECTALITRLLKEVHKYQEVAQILRYIKGDDFTEKHWLEVFSLLNIPPKNIDELKLKDFINAADALIDHVDDLQIMCKRAASEIVVRQALFELEQWEVQTRFTMTPHVDYQKRTVHLVKDYKDILNKIGDNQSLLQSVKNCSNYDSFMERTEIWETKLADLEDNVSALAQIQRKWTYLEPIFGGGTLDKEKSRFDKLDKDFRHILSFIERDTKVIALCHFTNLRSILNNIQDQLSRCQNSLDNFLVEKRNSFPRFLFLGDDDLLEVVGQSSKEQVIQAHLKKLFSGINSIKLDEDNKHIYAMCSSYGETVNLINKVAIDKPVEQWLNVLVDEMKSSLKKLLFQCLSEEKDLNPLKYPSQILCLAGSITFTEKCEKAITNMTLPPLLASYKNQLNHYRSLELDTDVSQVQDSSNEDTIVLELKQKALLLDTIHHITVLEELINANITKSSDWLWQKQLRFYKNPKGEVEIKMLNAKFEYTYEYLGNAQKLVRTPLTDQCFLTLTQAMHLGLGGNPYGPAGTGKTETIKALGLLLGRQVLVFNCDVGIDAVSMGRILSGLAKTGAWGCFDEFNRLDEATLSAVSMYIQPIQVALQNQTETLNLLGQQIKLNKHCGVFITLNPAGANYGGRNKLPDNLKQLFRPIVMTHPDHEQIAKTLLHCDGFRHAELIGSKLIEIFDIASKLLSKQLHYDWGLRAIKTVLNGCGKCLKQHRKNNKCEITLEIEIKIAMHVLKVDTLSKLTYYDSLKFDSLMRDVFNDVPDKMEENDLTLSDLEKTCQELKLMVNNRQINKCIELNEQLKQRMGVAIVGPPSSGKSTIRNILFNALVKSGQKIEQHIINPKSMPRNHLLGHIDKDTRQWSDGVLTACSLEVTSKSDDLNSWIVCDGDIDPEWVESLNSVLDDNRLLTLPSGWRIQFGKNVNFIFETDDLSYCSPATISRIGIVFLSEEDLNLNEYISNTIKKNESNPLLEDLVQNYFYRGVDWIFKNCEFVLPASKMCIVNTALSLINDSKNKTDFTLNMLNGFVCQLDGGFKEIFAQELYEWTNEMLPMKTFTSYYDYDKNIVTNYESVSDTTIKDISKGLPLIFTAQIYHTLSILKKWLMPNNEKHFLIVGPHGSTKTKLLNHLVNENLYGEIVTIYCTSHVSPSYVMYKLLQHCIVVNSNVGKIYKPKKGVLVLHFKGLHLVKNDKWGTNMLVSFLQQFIIYRGFYDSSLEWVGVQNVIVVGTLESTQSLSKRFTSLMHICSIESPQQDDVNIIFSTYLSAIIEKYFPNNPWNKNKVTKLLQMMIKIFNEIESSFSTADNIHYKISYHDLTKWCDGITHYQNPDESDCERALLEIVVYEATKIFGDKMVCESDRNKLLQIINNTVASHWSVTNISKLLEENFYVPISETTSRFGTCNLLKLNTENWTSVIKKGIQQYEREAQNLNILIIPELLLLTASIGKALSVPKSNIVLVGRTGIGRRSSLKISSALHNATIITPTSNKQPQFNNDLKLALQQAGIEGKQVYFLLEDHMFNNDITTNIINTLLYSGEVPELYNLQELDTITSPLKDEAANENFDGSLNEFFIERVLNNLHLVICIESENVRLLNIFENSPALYQKCTVIWKDLWSKSTIENLPSMFIEKFNSKSENNKIEASDGFYNIYDIVKSENPAPSRYISLIELYMETYLEKKQMITLKQGKLQIGVSKLTEARNTVDDLKVKATEQKEKLAEKQAQANSALDMISNTMTNTNIHKEQMESLKQQTEKENEQLIKRKKEIDLELAEVEPLILQARTAVGDIKTESLSEIRSLRAPPDIIRDILEGVLRLMGIQDTSWNSMKTFLAKRGVKEDIRTFDASRITSENRHAVERLMMTKSDSFDPKSAKRASVAAAPLAAWVKANVKYSQVVEKIKPLEREQNKLQQNLSNAKQQLNALSAGLVNVDNTVAHLKVQLSTYTKEAAEIEIDLNGAQERLNTAQELVEKLNDEYERWKLQLKTIDEEFETLPIFSLLSSAFITYLSGESEDKRSNILKEWTQKIIDKNFNFTLEEFLSTETDLLQWKSNGLPVDQLSIQNAIIILKTKMKPLIIDPTSVAIKWLKLHLKDKNLEVTTQDADKFKTTLELAIRFGKILLIEEVENVSPALFNILRNNLILEGARKLILLNGKLIDVHNDFQLILSSRNENLKLTSDVSSLLSIINFSITRAGLAEQLLTNTIMQENPSLEDRKRQLLHERESLQSKLYKLQDQLLEDLASSSGDILQNKSLISALNETKESSSAIKKALEESVQVENKLQIEYNTYRDITIFGSSLYFATIEFCTQNVLYLFSVPTYIRLFLKTVSTFEGTESNFDSRQRLLIQSVYQFTSRSLFKKDRMKLALHLIHKMLPNHITKEEWNLFLGNTLIGAKIQEELPAWIPEQYAQNVYNLQVALPELSKMLKLDEQDLWQNFMNKNECESHFPTHCKISEFQKVIVIQALRNDRLYTAMSMCILHLTGLKNLNSDILHLSQILKESTCKEPILLVTTSGNDPSSEIKELAQRDINPDHYKEIAMGEGQEALAVDSLKESVKHGHWLVLKNLHLVISWLPVLTQNLQSLDVHENFRLWLVTENHSEFNTVLAQNSLKLAYEAPQSIKNNLQGIYATWSEKVIKANTTSTRIFFVLACIHVLLKERRTYIPQGWSKWYEFNETDFDTAIKLIDDFWRINPNKIQWTYLSELCYNAVYRGKIENFDDLKILKSYFTEYLVEDVLSHRWRPFNLSVNLPSSENFMDYAKIISQFPAKDVPQFFGLPENINRAWETNTSFLIIKSLKDLQITDNVNFKFDREIWIKGLLPIMNMWKKINQNHDFIRVEIPDTAVTNNPVLDFIQDEYRNGIILVQFIHKSFAKLNKILKGTAVITEKDTVIANSLLTFKTPQTWYSLWDGPKDPIKYIKSVLNKVKFISAWKEESDENSFLKQPLNFSTIFNPNAFLASFKQYYSRKNNCTLDLLTLRTNWKEANDTNSITLTGLLVEGALFNNQNISPCSSNSDSINSAPNCSLTWQRKKEFTQSEETLEVPLYFNATRENLFVFLQVPCRAKDKDKWVQAGLAFYLEY